ncbi:MAG: hypothetical protein WC349_05170 [Patescibacteria group bacterium]
MGQVEAKKQLKNQIGVILLLTMFILSGILIITLGAADLVMAGIRMNRLTGYSSLGFFASEAGLEQALWEVRKNNYVLPDVDQDNIFQNIDIGNNSSFIVNYATSSPNVTFTSVGFYGGAKRSVESSFEFGSGGGGGPACAPDCTGKECGDDGCGGSCGSCVTGSCVAGVCVPVTYVCTGVDPENSTICTGDDTGLTEDTAKTLVGSCTDPVKCEYICDSGYDWNGSSCILAEVPSCRKEYNENIGGWDDYNYYYGVRNEEDLYGESSDRCDVWWYWDSNIIYEEHTLCSNFLDPSSIDIGGYRYTRGDEYDYELSGREAAWYFYEICREPL